MDAAEGVLAHPQLQPLSEQRRLRKSAEDEPCPDKRSPRDNERGRGTRTEDFWYHVRYDDDFDGDKAASKLCNYITEIKGEFWLSKQFIDKKNMYYHCSSTMSQAITMCTVFRFSCPMDYMKLIERAAGQACSEKAFGEKQE